MTATVAGIHLGIDTHANRPAGNAVPDGSLYSCTTHGLIYKSDFAGNSWATWATLGGGGLTHSYVGYNTVGGSWEGMTNQRFYNKKITLATDGLLTSISAYIKGNNQGGVVSFAAQITTDATGPKYLIAAIVGPTWSSFIDKAADPRWYHIPMGVWLTAGDYWIGFSNMTNSGSEQTQLAYDGSGSDPIFTSGGAWATEGDQYANTDSTYKYSIRASIIT